MAKVKLKDIAEKAGVSMMTVSRVMNNDPKVGEKTRQRISKIASDMQYKPNVAARHLASAKSFCIGVVCEYANASYVSKFVTGSLRKCRAIGYHVVLDELGNNPPNNKLDGVKDLVEVTNVDGVILLPPISDDASVLELLKTTNTKFVRIAPNIELLASSYICMDDYQAAFDITQHLISSGYKKIAHIIGNTEQGVSRLRYQGYIDALRSNQLDIPPYYIEQGDFSYKSGLDCAKKLLSLDNPPDAIFAANDEMAAAVVSVAHQLKLEVPETLSVVGFDDTELASIVWPNLSTVRQPLEEMADLAIQLLTNSNNVKKSDALDTSPSNNRYVLDYQIIKRDSSKSPDP